MRRVATFVLVACLVVALNPVPVLAGVQPNALKASRLWEWQNPAPQGNSLNALDFVGSTGATGWAVGAEGTVIKTLDGGATWIQQGSIAPQYPSSGDLAYDMVDVEFVDDTRGWAVGGNRVWRTTNGGTTWADVTPEYYDSTDAAPVYWRDVEFANSNYGIVVGKTKIYRTSNGGMTWTVCPNPGGLTVTGVNYDSPGGTAYVWGMFPGVLKSVNGGVSFTTLTVPGDYSAVWIGSVVPHSLGAYLLGGNQVWSYKPAGSQWVTQTLGLPEGEDLRQLVKADGDDAGANVWAVGELHHFKRGADDATPWTSGTHGVADGLQDLDVPGVGAFRAIAQGGVWSASTMDAWGDTSYGSPSDIVEDIEMLSSSTGFLVAGSEVFGTSDAGRTWGASGLGATAVFSDVSFLHDEPLTGWVVGSSVAGGPSVYRTENGGAVWGATGATQTMSAVGFFDADDGWGLGQSLGALYRTVDGGDNFARSDRAGYWYRDVEMVSDTTGFLYGEADNAQSSVAVLKTANEGSTWTTYTVSGAQGAGSLDFADASYGWLTDGFGDIFKTTNGGVTWTQLAGVGDSMVRLHDVKFVNRLEGWVVGHRETFPLGTDVQDVAYHTTDGGATWDSSHPLSNGGFTGSEVGLTSLAAVDGDTVWAAGGNSSVLKGATWPSRRVTGSDRYAVAAGLARTAFPDGFAGVTNVIIASGLDSKAADPLTAAGLAGVYKAPVLLVNGDDALQRIPAATNSTIDAIVAANPGKEIVVHAVGGTASVPAWVMTKLDAKARVTAKDRIAGADRYAVAANIAARMRLVLGPSYPKSCFVVNGQNAAYFFDALAASPVAVKQKWPILLVSSTAMPAATNTAKNSYTDRYVVGSASAVPAAIYNAVGGDERFTASPGDRYGNARDLATDAIARGWLAPRHVGVTNKLADALAGGSAMGHLGGPMLFCTATSLPSNSVAALMSANGTATVPVAYAVKRAYIVGGPVSVNESVKTSVDSTLRPAR